MRAFDAFMLLSLLVAAVRDLTGSSSFQTPLFGRKVGAEPIEMVARLGVWPSKSQYLFGHGEKASLNRLPLS